MIKNTEVQEYMNLLTIEKVTKSYTERILFDQITMGINEGDKIGVIGINGTGKSTLLKIIAGKEYPDQGNVVKGNKVTVEFLAQNPVFQDDLTILENVLHGKQARNEQWNLEGEAKAMLIKLGIVDSDMKPSHLSGGQRKRAALVRTLLTPADILVLDEPTNHLDNEMAEWLEDYLIKYRGAFIMVTHDRYFLDKVTNRIVELDKGSLYNYNTNYSGFLEQKAQREDMEQATERKNKSLYRVELEWMMRGARARSTKQKFKIRHFEELRDRKGIEVDQKVELNSLSSRLGNKTVELIGISKAYGTKQLIRDFSYIFLKQDRIGIIGPNGCGKTTLIKMINGIVPLDQGSIEIGQTVKIGYFSQENEYMNEDLKVIDYIRNVAEYIETSEGSASASQMLERFLFTSSMQYTQIARLSGGEKRRLYLLKVLMEAPNILILDEPTNDLDIQTLTILEDYLDNFQGIVLTVSHDRYFLDRIVERIFAFEEDGRMKQYEGNFTDYKISLEQKLALEQGQNAKSDAQNSKDNNGKTNYNKNREDKIKFTYNEQKEYNEIDGEISKLELAIETNNKEQESAVSDYSKLSELLEKKVKLEEELEYKMDRWVYLTDIAEQIELAKNKK